MAIKLLYLGLQPDDGSGTPGRDGGQIINDNFTELEDYNTNVTTPHVTDTNWNAHGNAAVGGGAFSLDDSLTIPATVSYKINGEDIVSRRSDFEIDLGVSNTSIAGNSTANTNVVVGHLNVFNFAPLRSFMAGIGNECNWTDDCLVGIDNETSTVIGGDNITFGINNYADRVSLSYGRDNIADFGSVVFGDGNTGNKGVVMGIGCETLGTSVFTMASGIDCSADAGQSSTSAFSYGINCSATGDNCGAIGIGITNTVINSIRIGPNNPTAIVIAGAGLGVALPTGLPLARLHTGPGSATVPSIIMDVSNRLINTPAAGAIEYSSITITKSIESIATTNPAQVTITDHLFADGSTVTVSSISDGAFTPSLINTTHEINVLDADTFELIGIECTSSPTPATGTAVGPHQDRYIYFTHQDSTRSNVVTIHATNIDDTDSPYPVEIKDSVVICDTTSGSVEVLLPTAASAKDRMLNIKRKPGAAGANIVTINPDGSENIEGSSVSFLLGVAGANAQIISDGTEWWVV